MNIQMTVPDYTNKALASPNVAGSIADQLIDVIPTAIAALPTDADVNAEVDTALNTEIPGTNTANSVNDILLDQLAPALAQRAAGVIAVDENTATDTLENVVNISNKGWLTGLHCTIYENTVDLGDPGTFGTVVVTIDGVALTTIVIPTQLVSSQTADGANNTISRFGTFSLSFNHRFLTSLQIQHKVNTAGGTIYSVASYTTD